MNDLKKAVGTIRMPTEMKERILTTCSQRSEEKLMKKAFYKRPLGIAVALVACVALIGATITASNGFRDVKDWTGAIVGQIYEAGEGEIALSAVYEEGGIRLTVDLLKGGERPYAFLDFLKPSQYELIDSNGKVQHVAVSLHDGIVAGGGTPLQTELLIPQALAEGTYHLVVREFVGIAKAEQDLPIRGHWECTFAVTE